MDSETISFQLNFLRLNLVPRRSLGAGNKRDEGDEFLPRQIYANVDRGDVESRGWKKKKKSVNIYGRERTVQPGPPAIHPSPRRGVEQLFERR